MTAEQEKEYRMFLGKVRYRGEPLTENGINTRIRRAKKSEALLKLEIEVIVSTDEKMRNALLKLRKTDVRGGRANAVRKYYEMRHGKAFPKLGDCMD